MRRWFEPCSQHFQTLELHVTFYRFPQLSFLEDWYAQSPPGSQFAVKAPQLSNFYDTTGRGLQEKLGPVLLQLPPRLAYDADWLTRMPDCLALPPQFYGARSGGHCGYA